MDIKKTVTQKDVEIMMYVQYHLRSKPLTAVNRLFSFMGDVSWFWIVVCVLMIARDYYRIQAYFALISLAVCSLFVNIGFKRTFRRERPYTLVPQIEVIGRKPRDYSFPSGHTAVALAAGFMFLFTMPLWFGITAVAIGVLIGMSRIYLGVHYPSDVIAGAVTAFMVSLPIYIVYF